MPRLTYSLNAVSDKTRRKYVQKASEAVSSVLKIIAEDEAGELWSLIKSSGEVDKQLGRPDGPEDQKYLKTLSEAYHNATTWSSRRQILSIISDIVSLQDISSFIPDISQYCVTLARKHRLLHGRGATVPQVKQARFRITETQLDHFLSFVTGPHIVQDLPFGQNNLKLSTGETVETPNVVRVMIPERIIDQYLQFCKELYFKPIGRRTLQRILSVCAASTRNSLQGLDYFLADGSKAFDDLCDLANTLAVHGFDQDEVMDFTSRLKSGKQYLKGDYKVHISEQSPVADHFIWFALSDMKDTSCNSDYEHNHDVACDRCEDKRA